ncbi:MAG: hypothetical protein U0990_08415 [Candidatus Nanopelagicales bacterium]|nr:hypothetical protein [Candidatus Nanopelagicales bacterium]MDZ4250099.1 hypothetical protein [Candidatus Nanopelagicales bacterium]
MTNAANVEPPDTVAGPYSRPQPAPRGLGSAGRKLWRAIAGMWELDAREVEILAQACRTADLIGDLERVRAADGMIVPGSTGIPRLSAVVGELRQQRSVLNQLLNSLSLPLDLSTAPGRQSRRHQLSVEKRWRRGQA